MPDKPLDASEQTPEAHASAPLPSSDEDFEYRPLSTLDACPECGHYYVLYETAPEAPYWLNPAEQEEWEARHCYNIIRCSVCGFNSEDD